MAGQPTPEQRTEAVRPVAEASAGAYVDALAAGGCDPDERIRRAFVDGYLTAIESLLTWADGG